MAKEENTESKVASSRQSNAYGSSINTIKN